MTVKKIAFGFLILIIIITIAILLLDWYIQTAYQERLYQQVKNVPARPVALVLGTSKQLANGQSNRYFRYRMEAAAALWEAGKVERFVLSGDNSRVGYNEPKDMQEALMARGIPKEHLILDYAGFRTLDSVVRCHQVFGFDRFLIISQPFHIERAVFIAQHKGLDALGLAAQDVEGVGGLKVQVREKLARVKVIIDLLFGVEPKFL